MGPADPLDDALAQLGFHLAVQEGFWFALVVSNDARTREHVRHAVTRDHPVRVVHVLEGPTHTLMGHILDADARLTWVVADGDPDRWEAATAELLMALNERREALRSAPGPLIVEGREQLKAVLRNLAPDLFSIRATIVETGQIAHETRDEPEVPSELDRFNHDVVAASLRQAGRMAGRDDLGARRSRVGALTRAAEALIAQGWFSEAAPVVEDLRVEAYALASEQFAEPWALAATALSESLTGAIRRATGDLGEAVAAFMTATWMRTLLHRDGDPWTARALARTRSELGQALLVRGELSDAENQLVESAALGQSVLTSGRDDPELASQVAMTLSVLGDLHLQRSRTDSPPADAIYHAREAYQDALSIRQDLAATGAARFSRYLGISWGRMGALAEAEGDLTEALRARERAADIARDLAAAHPDNAAWDMEYATTLGRVGEILCARGELDQAEEVLQDANARAERNSEEDPENARWLASVALSQLRLASVAEAREDTEAAVELIEEAIEIYKALTARDPTNERWRRELDEAQARLIRE